MSPEHFEPIARLVEVAYGESNDRRAIPSEVVFAALPKQGAPDLALVDWDKSSTGELTDRGLDHMERFRRAIQEADASV